MRTPTGQIGDGLEFIDAEVLLGLVGKLRPIRAAIRYFARDPSDDARRLRVERRRAPLEESVLRLFAATRDR